MALPRVVLIGDSIRIGYEEFVRERLESKADVISAEENARTSTVVLDNLQAWAIDPQPDIVHLNCGLHDIRREFGAEVNAVQLHDYARNLERIFQSLVENTQASVIWASTTPVNQQWHHQTKDFDRFEEDVLAYNAQAKAIAESMQLKINDLHAIIQQAGRDRLLRDDGVHYTPSGSRLLGHAVADVVSKALR
ncbi:MAG: SGNH/GDSL hydrolase family protein [Opitutales bacterium]